jgi:hypothetical protein
MAQAQKSSKGAGGGGKAGSKGKKATAGGKKVEDEREETLQAVVLADSFETRFNPFTLETPRVSHCASSIIILKFLTIFDTIILSYTSGNSETTPFHRFWKQ